LQWEKEGHSKNQQGVSYSDNREGKKIPGVGVNKMKKRRRTSSPKIPGGKGDQRESFLKTGEFPLAKKKRKGFGRRKAGSSTYQRDKSQTRNRL